MTNLAAAVERVKWLVNHNAKMEMIDRSDLETILAEMGSGAGVPAGWVLVPIEPNWDMRNEGREFLIDGLEKDYEKIAYFLWKTMVNASPKAPDTRPPVAGLAELTDAQLVELFDYIEVARGNAAQKHWASSETMQSWEARRKVVIAKAAREFLGKVDG